ncbi:MAG: class A beta-lactamase-related serine hydrolase [Acidobacteria bacterium]|nr:MAG: class A beta-lactamase-related serine hydrolase [Acidobacteriota bacterium]
MTEKRRPGARDGPRDLSGTSPCRGRLGGGATTIRFVAPRAASASRDAWIPACAGRKKPTLCEDDRTTVARHRRSTPVLHRHLAADRRGPTGGRKMNSTLDAPTATSRLAGLPVAAVPLRALRRAVLCSLLCAALALSAPALGTVATATTDETPPPTAEQIAAHPEVQGAIAALDAWLEAVRIYDDVPGFSVGFVHDQDLIWSGGYGASNLETGRAADAETIYSICSISKLFTAIAVLQQRDAGKLRLSDPVAEHLEWFSLRQAHEDSPTITVESLLTHSSGLPRESDFGYWAGPDFPFPTREQMIERLASQETLYPAQRLFQYSNLALSLAGEVVQATSGVPYEEYVQQQILDPLGLEHTRPRYPDELRGEQLAIGYTGIDRSRERVPVSPFYTRGITPAAGFTSTVEDLARFASWQFRLLEQGGDEVLDANTLREMQRVHWVDPDWETTWGLGFNVRRDGDTTLVGHSGGCPGYITQFVLAPKKKIAAIALTNAGDGPAWRIADAMLKVLGPAVAQAAKPGGKDEEDDAETAEDGQGDEGAETEEAAPDLSRYVGNYATQPWGGESAVRIWGDQLVAIDLPSRVLEKPTKLRHVEGDVFVRLTSDGEEREPWVFEFDAAAPDAAARLVVHGNPATRIPD